MESTVKGAWRSLGIKLDAFGIFVKTEGRVSHMKQVCKASEDGYVNVLEGIKRKTLVFGKNSLMAEFKLEKGNSLPLHKHTNEQTGYLISGHLILNIDGQDFEMHAGDSWCIQGDTDHAAEVIEDSIAIEVFSPIREDYLL